MFEFQKLRCVVKLGDTYFSVDTLLVNDTVWGADSFFL